MALACLALAQMIGCGSGEGSTSNDVLYPPGTTGGQGGAGGFGNSSGGAGGVGGTLAGAGGAAGMVNAGAGGVGGAAGMIAGAGGVGGAAGMIAGTGGVGGVGGTMAGAGGGGAGGTMAGAGGSGGDGPPPAMSAGCGKADNPGSDTFTIDVDGLEREYIVKIPSDYDASHPYRLIFTFHYLGGSAAGIARSYYGLESRSEGSAIFVSPEGIDAAWPNSGGRDVAFTKAMVEWMRENYCIDNERIFSHGFSYGAIMSNTVGCAMGDVFRAIAPIAGSGPRSFGGGGCVGQVAAMLFHGQSDGTVSFSSGQGSRDHWIEANHCETTSTPITPSQCVTYNGCDDGHPVSWCEYPGGHTQPSFAPDAVWAFFEQF